MVPFRKKKTIDELLGSSGEMSEKRVKKTIDLKLFERWNMQTIFSNKLLRKTFFLLKEQFTWTNDFAEKTNEIDGK